MKPNPFMALYHLTVPDSSTAARSACGYIGRSGRGRLGGSCCAVLLSTLRISLTWGPLGPGPARTSSVAPGGTLLWPLRSTTLTCKKASPDPLASCTKPNPLSALYHLTTAWTGGPEGASNLWMLDPDVDPKLRRAVSKLSSSKSRRRVGRKSLSLLLTCFLGSVWNSSNLKCGRGGRQRIPRDERPKPPLLCERDRKFESISLQQRVRLSPASAFVGREARLSAFGDGIDFANAKLFVMP